ncbi:Polysaccharide deacetylase domain-containing protein [Rozella allomycis CSF55]|uniref:Polysaccharide deacetylase domain-containing protein n=1 Tax=Rozella allomycis (strain CSF55) TaxID=988480 RepID=A0A075AZW5_ROZAC|nr:Polysaccharide deacetylase domain-containing protein [Rozella allomycis CSF55]|eukprot:EPZ35818.1 Polysaccharide deacetylase domain-containing protein [Rozella allomycis CSF55]
MSAHKALITSSTAYPPDDRGLFSVCLGSKNIAITFDDGPNPTSTPKVLDELKARKVKATFAVLGSLVQQNPSIAKRIIDEGHQIISHSWSHINYTTLSEAAIIDDLSKTRQVIKEATGYEVKYFRFPYGAYNSSTVDIVANQGYRMILWNVDSMDWSYLNPQKTTNSTLQQIKAAAPISPILLMHDIHIETANTMPVLLPELQKLSISFLNAEECVGLSEPKAQPGSQSESVNLHAGIPLISAIVFGALIIRYMFN